MSLSDAEPAENLIEDILDIDTPRNPANGMRGPPDIFRPQLDGVRTPRQERCDLSLSRLQALPMPRSRQRRVHPGTDSLIRTLGDLRYQTIQALARHCRDGEQICC